MSENATLYQGKSEKAIKTFDKSEFLNPKELSQFLNCSIGASYDLFNNPAFPGKKIPHVGWKVLKVDVLNYLQKLNKYGDQ